MTNESSLKILTDWTLRIVPQIVTGYRRRHLKKMRELRKLEAAGDPMARDYRELEQRRRSLLPRTTPETARLANATEHPYLSARIINEASRLAVHAKLNGSRRRQAALKIGFWGIYIVGLAAATLYTLILSSTSGILVALWAQEHLSRQLSVLLGAMAVGSIIMAWGMFQVMCFGSASVDVLNMPDVDRTG